MNIRSMKELSNVPPLKSRNKVSRSGITLTGGGYLYHIDRDRIDTPGKVLHWLAHLTDKDWFTTEDAHDLIVYAWTFNDVNPYAENA